MSSMTKVANVVCEVQGHSLTGYDELDTEPLRCSKCGMTLDEIRGLGELERAKAAGS